MKLIVGLGNPGKQYAKTYHNVGYMILDEFIQEKWSENAYAKYIKTEINTENVIIIKPLTYMNLSGSAINYFVNYYKINHRDILVIHDDLDLEIGSYRLKINSSSGGHNGIQSIIDALGTNTFLRLKIGISRPETIQAKEYVLRNLSKSNQNLINKNNLIYQNIINDFIAGLSAEELMNKYN